MISCIEGQIDILGNVIEIQTDLTTLIRAIEDSFAKKLGKDKAKELVEQSINLAIKFRDIPLGKAENEKPEPIADKLEADLKELERLINKIREVNNNGEAD